MDDENVLETIRESFLDLVDNAVDYTPRILTALVLLLVGWLVARYLSRAIAKLVDFIEENKAVKTFAKRMEVTIVNVSEVVGVLSFWAILLIFVSAAVDELGVEVLSDTFDDLIGFVPNLFAAALIAGLSFMFSNVMRHIVDDAAKKAGIAAHSFIGSAVKVAVLVFGLPLAAAQLGLDLTVITNNLTVIVAGVMLAFGLAFGMGGRDLAAKILEDHYKKLK